MKSANDIPDEWEVENVEVVTVNPHTGEVINNLSSSGAGPQTEQVQGDVKSRPCTNCDGEMILEAPMGAIVCQKCGQTYAPRIEDQPET